MARSTHTARLLLVALAALAMGRTATAQIPFTGTNSGSMTMAPTGPGQVHVIEAGSGTDTLGGAFTMTGSQDMQYFSPTYAIITNGDCTQTYALGTITSTYTGSGGENGIYTMDALITGGTGAYAGIGGTWAQVVQVTRTGPASADWTATLHGVAVPEPSTAASLVVGSGMAGLLLLRRRRSPRR
jgi:hypothetical protein